MHIVILNDFAYVDGGASKIALGSAKALAKRGHRVVLVTAVGPIDPDLLEIQGLTVHCLRQHEIVDDPNRLRAAVRGLWNYASAEYLREVLQSLPREDTVIHLHTWTKALSGSVVKVATTMGLPVVLTLHDYFSVCPTGGFYIYPTQQICTLQPMSAACIRTQCDSRSYGHKLWRVARQWVQEHPGGIPSSIQDFITISDLSAEVLTPLLPISATLHRINNFIEVGQGAEAAVQSNTCFSFVGRLSPEKGPQLLAEVCRDSGLQVAFIGDGIMRNLLSEMAPQATFYGWVAPAIAQAALRQSRALVFPSLWYETQGLVVTEAAALGIPVIVSSTSAAREWVEDGVTGLLFRTGDAADLGRAMIHLAENPENSAAMGREAFRRYWLRPATEDLHCMQLEAVYRSMLARQPQAAQVSV